MPVPRIALCSVALAGTLVVAGAASASAHVHVYPDSTASGSYSQLTFRVPTESATAATTRVVVTLPQDHPLASVSIRPLPGWTASVTEAPLPQPVVVSGTTLTKAPRTVTWTARPGSEVRPGQYQNFAISAGPLPPAGLLSLPVTQAYSDGTSVAWVEPAQPGRPEPEHPVPSFVVTAATVEGDGPPASAAAAEPTDAEPTDAEPADPTARWLGGASLLVSLLTAAGVVVLLRRRGRPA